jgi:hypothetical protein
LISILLLANGHALKPTLTKQPARNWKKKKNLGVKLLKLTVNNEH